MTNEYQKDRRARLKSEGLCTSCGNCPPIKDRLRCQECLTKGRQAVRKSKLKFNVKKKSEGLCQCGLTPVPGSKLCVECQRKTKERYYRRKALGKCAYCESIALPDLTRCEKCQEKHRVDWKELRLEVFQAYGGPVCKCCGETIERFLTIDHENNDGKDHRKLVGRTVMKDLKKRGFPPGFQILCFNCNLGRQLNGGICPHQQKEAYA